MQTFKTAFVVVLLLFVLYSGYIALNGNDTPLNPELQDLIGLETVPDVSGPGSTLSPFPSGTASTGTGGFEAFSNTPQPTFGSASATNSPFSQPVLPQTSTTSTSPGSISPPELPNSSLLISSPRDVPPTLPEVTKNDTFSSSFTSPSSNSNPVPLLPPLPSSGPKLELSETESAPISTATPTFGLSNSSSSVPADFVSNANLPRMTSNDVASSSPDLDLETPSPSGGIKSTSVSKSYENAKDLAMEQINRGNLKDGLATLSTFYNAPELTTEQRNDLLDLLDALTREVVYSRRHLLESVYVVAPGETMTDVAKRYDVPPEILARINAIENTQQLPSGAKLKVVPGPFRAEVDLNRGELTLFLGDLYAGRYPVSFGSDPAPKAGLFQVIDKQTNRNYYGNGVQIAANDPRNPYGSCWIDLGQDICIHGTSDGPSDSKLGCISLSPMDASDVFGMLGRGSPVTIRQ